MLSYYRETSEKISKFEQAIIHLDEVFTVYDQYKLSELKDAAIRRFSICCKSLNKKHKQK